MGNQVTMHIDDRILFLIIGAFIVLLALLIVFVVKKIRNRPLPMDEMEGHDFEYYCADILKAHGFIEVEVTKGSGDFGADILAEKDGVTYAVNVMTNPLGLKLCRRFMQAEITMTEWLELS